MRAFILGFLLACGLAGAAPAQTQTPAAVNGCIYYSSLPTLVNGQRNSFLCDVNGKLLTTSSGGGGSPGGSNTQIQYNNAGAFGGVSGWTTDGANALTGAASTTLAIGGATIGANAAAITGTVDISGNTTLGSAAQLLWSTDLSIGRQGAASLRIGPPDAAAPVAQTIGPQSVVAGTSNTAGAVFTINDSGSTGSANGGGWQFRGTPAGSSGSTPNARANAMTLSTGGNAVFSGSVLGASFTSQSNYNVTATGYYGHLGRSRIYSPADGNFQLTNNANNNFGLLQFAGTTSAEPALKRSTTTLQVRLADDSAFTNIQGKLTTDNAYVATPAVSTGTVIMYDSAGTALRVLVANP
jgi:hypothetical protein